VSLPENCSPPHNETKLVLLAVAIPYTPAYYWLWTQVGEFMNHTHRIMMSIRTFNEICIIKALVYVQQEVSFHKL